jgi:hypothetical protein
MYTRLTYLISFVLVVFPVDIGDCKVDDLGLAILEEDWLKDNSLTEPQNEIE